MNLSACSHSQADSGFTVRVERKSEKIVIIKIQIISFNHIKKIP